MIRAIRYESALKMPPTGKLKTAEIESLTQWVKMGAPWPNEKVRPAPLSLQGEMAFTDVQQNSGPSSLSKAGAAAR